MPVDGQAQRPEVVQLAADLIAIDTTNTGGAGTVGERMAAEYVAARLAEVGGHPAVLEATSGRTNVVLRIPGTAGADSPDGVVMHGHLDAVPADPDDWSVDPFGGVVRDGSLWGRGAIDMKGSDAVMLTVARRWLTSGFRPRHDVVFCWLADEEAGGALGAGWLTRERPELFAGCGTAIGEVGGFSVPLGPAATIYPVMTAERAHGHLTVTAHGPAGHGSLAAAGNSIDVLAGAITRLAAHPFPVVGNTAVTGFLQALGRLWKVDLAGLPLPAALAAIGPLRRLVEPGMRNSLVPTMIQAGHAPNAVPGRARAVFDCRILPGGVAEFRDRLADLIGPELIVDFDLRTDGTESPFNGAVIDAMGVALRRHDPGAIAVPYQVSASTDAPHFARLGLRTYGFTPLQLPLGFPYADLFHGPDERVPLAALTFGVDVLGDFLEVA